MTAEIEHGPPEEHPTRKKAKQRIEDFEAEELGRIACQIVDDEIGAAGSCLWKPPLFRSVNYAATIASGDSFAVSVQARKMQIESGVFAAEPCTAEIMRGRRQSSLVETTADGLEIDHAYAAFERVWEGGYFPRR